MEDLKISSKRKKDHIDLARSAVEFNNDPRFYYEPLLKGMPSNESNPVNFLGFKLNAPIWISSMTGGTAKAKQINHNLAMACGKYGLGMGLGSCRRLLDDVSGIEDFDVKALMNGQPLFANLGIAQIEELIRDNALDKVHNLIEKLEADGLIVHINPLQEWLQPEGDFIKIPPIETLSELRKNYSGLLIVKEVGQGFGMQSLKALFELKVDAIEFGAFGGTNFSKLELLRSQDQAQYEALTKIGHTAEEMVDFCNELYNEENKNVQLIISGGIRNFLDGYYLCSKAKHHSIYGQAGVFLQRALIDTQEVFNFVSKEIQALRICQTYLSLKSNRIK